MLAHSDFSSIQRPLGRFAHYLSQIHWEAEHQALLTLLATLPDLPIEDALRKILLFIKSSGLSPAKATVTTDAQVTEHLLTMEELLSFSKHATARAFVDTASQWLKQSGRSDILDRFLVLVDSQEGAPIVEASNDIMFGLRDCFKTVLLATPPSLTQITPKLPPAATTKLCS